jgi:hypothetical protein
MNTPADKEEYLAHKDADSIASLTRSHHDLLEACKEVLRTAESLGDERGFEITQEALCWVKDAVSKAQGSL